MKHKQLIEIFSLIAQAIQEKLDFPLQGMLFDIENNNFWHYSWGEKPPTLNEKIAKVEAFFVTYPKLIPIYGHRYMPSEPNQSGNPIFSVYQMDIIYYGIDLVDYLKREFSESTYYFDYPNRKILFWSEIAESEIIYQDNTNEH